MSELDSKAAGLLNQLEHETASSARRIMVVGSRSCGRTLAAMLALQAIDFDLVMVDPADRIDLNSHPRGEGTNQTSAMEVSRPPAAWMHANLQALKLQAGEPFHPLSPEASGKRRAQWKSEIPYRRKP